VRACVRVCTSAGRREGRRRVGDCQGGRRWVNVGRVSVGMVSRGAGRVRVRKVRVVKARVGVGVTVQRVFCVCWSGGGSTGWSFRRKGWARFEFCFSICVCKKS